MILDFRGFFFFYKLLVRVGIYVLGLRIEVEKVQSVRLNVDRFQDVKYIFNLCGICFFFFESESILLYCRLEMQLEY